MASKSVVKRLPKTGSKSSVLQNYYAKIKNTNAYTQNDAHKLNLRHPSYCLIVGKSGSGKTNVLMNLLVNPETKFMWDRCYVFCRFMDEPLYKLLRESIEARQAKYEKKHGDLGYEMLTISDNLDDLPPLEDLQANEDEQDLQTIFVFDDHMLASKKHMKKIELYFTTIRKINAGGTALFLAQRNTEVPRVIRSACGYVILFAPGNLREEKILAEDYAGELDKETFRKILVNETKTKLGDKIQRSLCIEVNSSDPATKYRVDLVNPIDISKYVGTTSMSDDSGEDESSSE